MRLGLADWRRLITEALGDLRSTDPEAARAPRRANSGAVFCGFASLNPQPIEKTGNRNG
jgi:hypothetical protein